jgi:hypothetical protein
LAARFNFEVVAHDNSGETSAIEMATAVCRERGADSTLVVPADIPLIDSSELQRIVVSAPPGGAVLVPDAAGRGTNSPLPVNVFDVSSLFTDSESRKNLLPRQPRSQPPSQSPSERTTTCGICWQIEGDSITHVTCCYPLHYLGWPHHGLPSFTLLFR